MVRSRHLETTMTFYYFAYGSNMLTARLQARCPSAVPLGRAEVADYVVEFSKRSSVDQSGKATLSGAVGHSHSSSGVLFEIATAELGQLDRAEGNGKGYDRDDNFPVRLVGGSGIVHARSYLATETVSSLKPYDWYLALVIAGAHEHDLGEDYLAGLRRVAFDDDRDSARKTRRAALEALAAAGFPDYRVLLSPT